ncbi:hypothetical protein [Spirilliplanes yamanashiensis]|uniref:Uncharacterized protein n=1 Tax=Spirilliplanes yamanashiensis TaxID=42233 RepID=A0A8J3YBA9_9ACTN|nr:hypothetical protein [Spirilliplanes yamanashiensis]MDP9817857.1 hypothetical protein [Spirilliplanes yamanashiensis]GIJ04667.1 hypothetical protein Sya03_40190 [Spirilliplanes yamanashiensis]
MPSDRASGGGAARAWRAADAAVGLYGDPAVPWSIVVRATLAEPVAAGAVAARLAALTGRHPHLGAAPDVAEVDGDPAGPLAAFAARAYTPDRPLIRAAVADGGRTLLLAAHHGAVDGLGLLGVLGAALDRPVTSGAAGLRARPAVRSFAAGAVRRAAEALVAPPTRLRVCPDGAGGGETLAERAVAAARLDTAALVAATTAAVAWWNGAPPRRAVVAVGASRRPGSDPAPELRSVYLRLRVPAGADRAAARRLLAAARPEPDFPPSRSRAVALARRALAGRLGATALVSNLGAVDAGGAVSALAFYPQPSGPAGLAVGLASVGGAATVTIRARGRDLGVAAADRLLDRIVAGLRAGG